jgi:transposase-like protein
MLKDTNRRNGKAVAKRRRRKKDSGPFSAELLDQLLAGVESTELVGPDGLLKQLTKALVERAMDAELDDHLGYERGQEPPVAQENRRNGTSSKTLRTEHGPVTVSVPRDREGSFDPKIVPKHQRHFDGFDDKILSMYARGMSVRDIRGHLEEIYGVNVSPDLISRVTDGVLEELKLWQNRPLDELYLVVFVDAIVVKIRDSGVVQNKAVHVVVGIDTEGQKNVLGLWIAKTEGAKFWNSVLNELRNRGVQDILVLCADGLTGLPKAVEAAFPDTVFQTCIVHLIRSSTRYVSWSERKKLCAALRHVYTAASHEAAESALDAFEEQYGRRHPRVVKAWRERWNEVTPFLAFPPEIRKAIYTTNTIEALNRQLRKAIKTRGAFPTDQAALKLLFLAARNAQKTWKRPFPGWVRSRAQFSIQFESRMP